MNENDAKVRPITDDYPCCIHCGQRVSMVNFALGAQWMHWPTPYGNYRTRELYRICEARTVATPPTEGVSA